VAGSLLILLPTLLALGLASQVGAVAYLLLLPWTVPGVLLVAWALRAERPIRIEAVLGSASVCGLLSRNRRKAGSRWVYNDSTTFGQLALVDLQRSRRRNSHDDVPSQIKAGEPVQ
jgi:hypothetical protein